MVDRGNRRIDSEDAKLQWELAEDIAWCFGDKGLTGMIRLSGQ
jgi:hypothetical protein